MSEFFTERRRVVFDQLLMGILQAWIGMDQRRRHVSCLGGQVCDALVGCANENDAANMR